MIGPGHAHFASVFSIETSSRGGVGDHPYPPWIRHCILGLQAQKGGGSNFGPNVKKPTSWPKRGGGPDPMDPPPLDPLLSSIAVISEVVALKVKQYALMYIL